MIQSVCRIARLDVDDLTDKKSKLFIMLFMGVGVKRLPLSIVRRAKPRIASSFLIENVPYSDALPTTKS